MSQTAVPKIDDLIIVKHPVDLSEDQTQKAPEDMGGREVSWMRRTWNDASTMKRVAMVGIPVILLILGALAIAGWKTGFFESSAFKDAFNVLVDWGKTPASLTNGNVLGICGGTVGFIILAGLGIKYLVEKSRRDPQQPENLGDQPQVNNLGGQPQVNDDPLIQSDHVDEHTENAEKLGDTEVPAGDPLPTEGQTVKQD